MMKVHQTFDGILSFVHGETGEEEGRIIPYKKNDYSQTCYRYKAESTPKRGTPNAKVFGEIADAAAWILRRSRAANDEGSKAGRMFDNLQDALMESGALLSKARDTFFHEVEVMQPMVGRAIELLRGVQCLIEEMRAEREQEKLNGENDD